MSKNEKKEIWFVPWSKSDLTYYVVKCNIGFVVRRGSRHARFPIDYRQFDMSAGGKE